MEIDAQITQALREMGGTASFEQLMRYLEPYLRQWDIVTARARMEGRLKVLTADGSVACKKGVWEIQSGKRQIPVQKTTKRKTKSDLVPMTEAELAVIRWGIEEGWGNQKIHQKVEEVSGIKRTEEKVRYYKRQFQGKLLR